jgi:hypothetical protein
MRTRRLTYCNEGQGHIAGVLELNRPAHHTQLLVGVVGLTDKSEPFARDDAVVIGEGKDPPSRSQNAALERRALPFRGSSK